MATARHSFEAIALLLLASPAVAHSPNNYAGHDIAWCAYQDPNSPGQVLCTDPLADPCAEGHSDHGQGFHNHGRFYPPTRSEACLTHSSRVSMTATHAQIGRDETAYIRLDFEPPISRLVKVGWEQGENDGDFNGTPLYWRTNGAGAFDFILTCDNAGTDGANLRNKFAILEPDDSSDDYRIGSPGSALVYVDCPVEVAPPPPPPPPPPDDILPPACEVGEHEHDEYECHADETNHDNDELGCHDNPPHPFHSGCPGPNTWPGHDCASLSFHRHDSAFEGECHSADFEHGVTGCGMGWHLHDDFECHDPDTDHTAPLVCHDGDETGNHCRVWGEGHSHDCANCDNQDGLCGWAEPDGSGHRHPWQCPSICPGGEHEHDSFGCHAESVDHGPPPDAPPPPACASGQHEHGDLDCHPEGDDHTPPPADPPPPPPYVPPPCPSLMIESVEARRSKPNTSYVEIHATHSVPWIRCVSGMVGIREIDGKRWWRSFGRGPVVFWQNYDDEVKYCIYLVRRFSDGRRSWKSPEVCTTYGPFEIALPEGTPDAEPSTTGIQPALITSMD